MKSVPHFVRPHRYAMKVWLEEIVAGNVRTRKVLKAFVLLTTQIVASSEVQKDWKEKKKGVV